MIAGSPRELFLAGLGDLLAKIISYLDWRLSRTMTDEYFCPVIAEASLASARQALAAARALDADPRSAARTLTDAVLTSGFAMQSLGGSRPAASAEHTIAHYWEMTGTVGNPRWDLHGVLVGAASRIVLGAYRRLFGMLPTFQPDPASRLAAYDRQPPWERTVEEGMRPFLPKIREEMAMRRFDRGILADRLARFAGRREEILATCEIENVDALRAAIAAEIPIRVGGDDLQRAGLRCAAGGCCRGGGGRGPQGDRRKAGLGQPSADADGLGTITHSWQAETAPDVWATAGTGDTFTPTDPVVGQRLRVVASFTDGAGNPESVTSDPTAAVTAVNDPATGAPTLSDTTPEVGAPVSVAAVRIQRASMMLPPQN